MVNKHPNKTEILCHEMESCPSDPIAVVISPALKSCEVAQRCIANGTLHNISERAATHGSTAFSQLHLTPSPRVTMYLLQAKPPSLSCR